MYMAYKNPEDARAYCRNYYRKNKPKFLEYNRQWRKKNPERANAIATKYRAKKGRITKRAQLLYKYGLSIEKYEALLETQNGFCAICNTSSHRSLVVDHCHLTQKVRGLLCHDCNLALGLLRDDPDRLRNAIAYLNNI